MTVCEKKSKLMLAGVFIACASGLIALRFASATAGSGIV